MKLYLELNNEFLNNNENFNKKELKTLKNV